MAQFNFEEFLGNPLLNLGVGMMAGAEQPGAGLGGSLLGGLSFSQDQQRFRLQNQAMRQKLQDDVRRREVMEQLPGLLGAGLPEGTPPQMMGLLGALAQIAPEQLAGSVANGMFSRGSERAEPSDLRMMDAIGLERTPENYAKFKAMSAANNGQGMDPLQQAQLMKLMLDMGNMKDERDKTRTTEQKTRRATEIELNRSFGQIKDLVKIADELEGTFLEPGVPGRDYLRAGGASIAALGKQLGWDTEKTQSTIEKADKLKKGLSDVLIKSTKRLEGTLTNDKLTLLSDAAARPDISGGAIRSVLGQLTESMLDASDIEGYALDDPSGMQDFIKQMKSPRAPKTGQPVVDVPKLADDVSAAATNAAGKAADAGRKVATRAADIARMTADQIKALDVDELATDQLQALDKRLRELGM
jgi:hypothetical protein